MALTLNPSGASITDPLAPSPDFSTGIPQAQVSIDTVPAFGENPWDAQQREQDARRQEHQQQAQDRIFKIALEPDSYFKDKELGPDPETTKRVALNTAFMEFATDSPVPMESSDRVRQMVRAKVARLHFDGRGADSEEAFHQELTKAAQGTKDRENLNQSLASDAAVSAAFQTVGGEQPVTFATWRETAKSKPGYDPTAEPDYFEGWHRATTAVKAAYADFETPLSRIWNDFKNAPEDVASSARNAYYQVPDTQRMRFMSALKVLAQKLPKEEQAAFWTNLKKQTGRDTGGFVSSAMDALDAFTAGSAAANAPDNAGIVAQAGMEREATDFSADVTRIQQSDFDPIKYLSTDDTSWSRTFEKAAYGAPGAVATSLVAAVPFVGMPMFYLSSQESVYQDYRQKFQAAGMSYQDAARQATNLAPIAALPQVVAEKFQIEMVAGRLPVFEKALAALNSRIASKAAQFATRTVVGAAEEGMLEQAQDYIPAAVQDIAHALSVDVPDVQWRNGKDGILDGFWKDSAGMMATMLPLAIFGAGIGVVKDSRRVEAFQAATDQQLLALGVSPEKVSNIRMAKDFVSSVAAIDAAVETLDPTSETAAKATAAEIQQIEDLKKAIAEASRSGVLPNFIRNSQGWTVQDGETGADLSTSPDIPGAWKIAKAHSSAIEDLQADHIAYISTMMEATDAAHALDGEASDTTTRLELGTVFTEALAATESPEAAARYAEQVALKEKASGGDGSISYQILGNSKTDPDSLKRSIRTTVNRLFAGASVTDVFHETFHGFRREALASGRITRADEIRMLRSLDTVLAGKVHRADGTPLRFIPDGMADDAITETHLDEAFSEIGEMEILRSRTGTQSKTKLVSPGIITRNLTAIARLAPEAARKFSAFLAAVRAHWGLSMSRALALKKAERDGKFDAGEYDAYLAKMLGLDQADAHLQESANVAQEITGGDPFSLKSSRMIETLNSNAITRIQSPARRHEAMSRLSRKLEDLRITAERIELMAGVKRLKKSIRTEAKRIEETRLAELELKVWADFQDVLTDADLQRIKAQPAHELLAVTRADGTVDPLHGRLMSLATASKKHPDLFQIHRPGDYDGADGLSPTNFGGTLMPTEAAQELYNANRIKEPTPDAMWQELAKEEASVAKMKEHAKKAKERMREARVTAKKEANDWLASQVDHQQAHFSDKQEILRALAVLDGILSVVPAEIRGRVGGYTALASLGSNETRLVFLQDKLSRVDREIEHWLKLQYDKEFRALLEKAKPAKDAPGEKPKGKITASIHELFKSIEAAMRMSAAEVEAKAVSLESLVASGDYTPEEENHMTLEANLIRLAGNWANASAAQREMALTEATHVYEKGYLARQKEISLNRETTKARRGDLAKGTGKTGSELGRKKMEEYGRTNLGTAKKFFLSLLGWEQIVGYSFGDNTAEARRLIDAEREAANRKADALHDHWTGIEDLFIRLAGGKGRYEKTFAQAALKGQQIRARLSERRQPLDSNGKAQTPKGIKASNGIYYSEMEAIQATLMWMQEAGRRHMMGHQDENGAYTGEWHYDQAFVDSLEDGMSEEAKAVRLHLMEHYAAEYDRLNPIYKALNGVNLPRHKFYSPLTMKPMVGSGSADAFDPVTSAAMSSQGFTPGSLKTRGEAIAEPQFRDALQTFERHVMQMEHWMAYAQFSSEANQILNNRTLKNAVEEKAGAEATVLLDGWVKLFAAGGTRDAAAHLAATQSVNNALNRAATTALVGRASVIAVQSMQLGAAINAMPTGAYVNRLAKLLSGNLQWFVGQDTHISSSYIQRRLKDMPPIVRQALAGLHTGTPNQLKHQIARLGHLIGGADALFTAGTYAMIYDYNLKVVAPAQNLTGPDAIAFAHQQAERETERVAQPTRAGTRSYFENVSTTPAMKLAWAFASEPRQKMALMIYNLGRADLSVSQKARSVFVAYGIGGLIANILRAAVRDMRDGGDDEEVFDERNWNPALLTLQAVTSPLQGIPFVGDGLQAVGYKLTGQYAPEGNLFSAVDKAATAATKLPGHFHEGDTMHTIRDVEDILTGLALGSDNATAAASVVHILRDLYGVTSNTLNLFN